MSRSVANAVANARPARASSGVGPAKSLGKVVGVPGSPQVPQVNQKGGANRAASLNPLTKRVESSAPTAAAATNPSTGLPWDARAEQEAQEAKTGYENTEAELAGNWTAREGYYGFGANGADNPYSQAALLATHHEWNERGRSNASGLQTFAGSNVNAERQEVGRYTTSYGQLLQAYEDEKAAKERDEEAAKRSYEGVAGEGGTAQLGALQRAGETEPQPVAAPVSPDGGGGGGSSKLPKPANAPSGKKWAWNGSQWHLVKA
jgi:hypothetical protein